jgi:hypothetical protein
VRAQILLTRRRRGILFDGDRQGAGDGELGSQRRS